MIVEAETLEHVKCWINVDHVTEAYPSHIDSLEFPVCQVVLINGRNFYVREVYLTRPDRGLEDITCEIMELRWAVENISNNP